MQVAATMFKLEKGSFQAGSLIRLCCPCGTCFGCMKDTRMKGCVFFFFRFQRHAEARQSAAVLELL